MRQLKYEAHNITVLDTTVDGTVTTATAFQLDKNFKKILGVGLYLKADGGQDSYDVKIEHAGGTVIHDLCDSQDLAPLSNERYVPFGEIENVGQDIIITTKNYGTLTADLVYQLVFLLATE